MLPTLEQLAANYAGHAKVVKAEMDKNQQTALAWSVRAASKLLLFKGARCMPCTSAWRRRHNSPS